MTRLGVVSGACLAAYPVLVYFCIGRVDPGVLAAVVAVVALIRMAVVRNALVGAAAAMAVLVAACSWQGMGWVPVKFYAVGVNLILFALFAGSLVFPPTMVEKIARVREPDLPPEAVLYTRRVTQVWAGFFVLNGWAALVTALWASDRVWMLYNGFVAYCLMFIIAVGEWLVRQQVRRRITARHGQA